MPKEKLTAEFCRIIYCDPYKTKEEYFDTEIKGFTLEVRPSGTKTFYLRYADPHGKLRQHRIGRYGDITLDQARKKARELKSQVVLGGDPAAAKAEAKAVITYGELADQHLAHARTYLRRPQDLETILRVHFKPRWGKERINAIRSQDIAKWLADKLESGLSPATVEKLRVTMNRSFELARQWSLPGSEVNPVKGVPRRKFNNKRERFLTAKEVARLKAAVRASINPQLQYIVELLLLTGARKNELLFAKWQQVDLDRKAWRIPDSKTGKPRYVPLSNAACDVIRRLPRFDGCDWLLPNPATLKPYTDIKHPWDTARTAAGLDGLRLHDLRHTAASAMCAAGVDLYTIGKVLGHADYQSTMRYSHLADSKLLAAAEAGAAQLLG